MKYFFRYVMHNINYYEISSLKIYLRLFIIKYTKKNRSPPHYF